MTQKALSYISYTQIWHPKSKSFYTTIPTSTNSPRTRQTALWPSALSYSSNFVLVVFFFCVCLHSQSAFNLTLQGGFGAGTYLFIYIVPLYEKSINRQIWKPPAVQNSAIRAADVDISAK